MAHQHRKNNAVWLATWKQNHIMIRLNKNSTPGTNNTEYWWVHGKTMEASHTVGMMENVEWATYEFGTCRSLSG